MRFMVGCGMIGLWIMIAVVFMICLYLFSDTPGGQPPEARHQSEISRQLINLQNALHYAAQAQQKAANGDLDAISSAMSRMGKVEIMTDDILNDVGHSSSPQTAEQTVRDLDKLKDLYHGIQTRQNEALNRRQAYSKTLEGAISTLRRLETETEHALAKHEVALKNDKTLRDMRVSYMLMITTCSEGKRILDRARENPAQITNGLQCAPLLLASIETIQSSGSGGNRADEEISKTMHSYIDQEGSLQQISAQLMDILAVSSEMHNDASNFLGKIVGHRLAMQQERQIEESYILQENRSAVVKYSGFAAGLGLFFTILMIAVSGGPKERMEDDIPISAHTDTTRRTVRERLQDLEARMETLENNPPTTVDTDD